MEDGGFHAAAEACCRRKSCPWRGNVMLNERKAELERRGTRASMWYDDCLILQKRKAERIMETLCHSSQENYQPIRNDKSRTPGQDKVDTNMALTGIKGNAARAEDTPVCGKNEERIRADNQRK
ncbi:MAG: hypothetical protein ACLR0U_14770 [Enterocloster clostridioformis]